MNSSLWPCLKITSVNSIFTDDQQCFVCRLGGIIIVCLSIFCFKFNCHYLIWCCRRRRTKNLLVLSLFLASLLVLIISVPSAAVQLLTCRRHCYEFFCRLEGFTSYFGGSLCMLIYVMLSLYRYLSIRQYNVCLFEYYSTGFCWIFALFWTLPPLFHVWISYTPEGLGSHCSINWNDHSRSSFYYILFSFLFIYLFPLIVLIFVSLHVHQLIRNLYSYQEFQYVKQNTSDHADLSLMNRKGCFSQQKLINRTDLTACYQHKAANRRRMKIQYRSIRSIIFLLSFYLIAWTPYSILAILQLLHIEFIFHYSFLITLTAFLAKSSTISTPMAYLYLTNVRTFKKILLC